MPFLFHAPKKSIFDVTEKDDKLDQFQAIKLQAIEQKKRRSPQSYSINVQICKDHPFRKINKQNINELQKDSLQNEQFYTLQKQKIISKYKFSKAIKSKQMFQKVVNQLNDCQPNAQNNQINNQICLNDYIQNSNKNRLTPEQNAFSSLNRKSQSKKNQVNKKLASKKSGCAKQANKKQRLIFEVPYAPGPGRYQNQIIQNYKSLVLYKPTKIRNNTVQARQHFTNQFKDNNSFQNASPNMKSFLCSDQKSELNSKIKQRLFFDKQKKNKKLLDLILSNHKFDKDKIFQDTEEFEILKNNHPSPDKYQFKSEFQRKHQNKNNVFISGVERLPNIKASINCNNSQIVQQDNTNLSQNNKKKIVVPFSNSSARQLKFDNQQLCKQEFYYTPKNNLVDDLKQKTKFKTKNYFGSSLQRFDIIQQKQDFDCYKYCFSKIPQKYINPSVSLNFTQKRQIFKDYTNNSVGPKYSPANGTIEQKLQKQIFKTLLKSKFKDQVINMKRKKKQLQDNVENVKKSDKMITSSKVNGQKQHGKSNSSFSKMQENKNISFGQSILAKNERGIKIKPQFDGYYDKQLNWNIFSFNKQYQYC